MAALTTSYQKIADKLIGTVSGSGVSAKNLYLRIYAKYTSQDIVANKSSVSYKSTLYVDGSGTYFYTGNYTNKSLSGTGATAASGDAQGNYNVGETTLNEITGTITHGTAGDASISVTAGWSSTPWEISGSVTGTATLPTIARKTTPTFSATTVTMGSSITITMAPANSTFKHRLRYSFANSGDLESGLSTGANFTAQGNTTATFTPPTSLGDFIPNANSGVCTVMCLTYTSDGTFIGTTESKITLNIPSYTPEINSVTLTGNNLLSSTYVKGKSTVTGNATLKTYYGATVKSVVATVDGSSYSSLPFTSSALSNGSKTVVIKFTDSRDKSVTYTSSAFTVYDYSAPQITDFTLERQSDGTTVIATIKGSIAAVNNKNTKTIKVVLNGVTNTVTSSSYTISATTTFTNVNTDATLTATATFTDYYGSVSKQSVVPTVAVTMDFHSGGAGIGIGKVSESSDLLDVAWSQRVRKNLTVDGTQTVTGNSTLNGNLSVKGTLGVTGATSLNKASTISDDVLGILTLKRNHASNGASIKFQNNTAVLGYIGMTGSTANGGLKRWNATDTNTAYTFLDTGNLTNTVKDYIIEQGTYSDGWEYCKWANGRIELWADKSITFPDPTNMGNYLWRSIYSLDMSSKLKSIISGTCCVQYSGMLPTFSRHSTTLTMGEVVVATSKSFTSFTTVVPIYIIGKWK